nr:EOG090X0JRY [Leptodora kindtii]
MDVLSNLVRVSLPNYLASLPIPDSFTGWFRLGVRDWAYLVPFGAAVAGISYLAYDKVSTLMGCCPGKAVAVAAEPKKPMVNLEVKKDMAKVVDSFDIEDVGDKAVYCRCWRSAKFPYCDGAHTKHNNETGDNVGPLIVSKKSN